MEMANKSLVWLAVLAACVVQAAAQWSPATATFYGGVDTMGTYHYVTNLNMRHKSEMRVKSIISDLKKLDAPHQ
jgi:hypothetical protein